MALSQRASLVFIFPIIIFFVGVWGLITDIIHQLGILSKDETRTEFFNVFFFHTFFERIEDAKPVVDQYLNFLGQFLLFIVCLGVMIYYVYQAKKAQSGWEKRGAS